MLPARIVKLTGSPFCRPCWHPTPPHKTPESQWLPSRSESAAGSTASKPRCSKTLLQQPPTAKGHRSHRLLRSWVGYTLITWPINTKFSNKKSFIMFSEYLYTFKYGIVMMQPNFYYYLAVVTWVERLWIFSLLLVYKDIIMIYLLWKYHGLTKLQNLVTTVCKIKNAIIRNSIITCILIARSCLLPEQI